MIEYILKPATAEIIKSISGFLKTKFRSNSLTETIWIDNSPKEYLKQHVNYLYNWSSEISIKQLIRSKELKSVFLDLELNLVKRSVSDSIKNDRSFKASLLHLYDKNLLVLGNPGAGKTTTIKKNIQECLTNTSKVPILLQFRKLSDRDLLYDQLLRSFGVIIKAKKELEPHELKSLRRKALIDLINQHDVLLCLDGLDELPLTIKNEVIMDLDDLLLNVDNGKIIITCRTGGYVKGLKNVEELEIAPLSDNQINEFSYSWLGQKNGKLLIEKINLTPYKGTEVRPLTLAHLCAIFERTKDIPEQPSEIYSDIARLLIKEWDQDRLIIRSPTIKNFNVRKKELFLENLSYFLRIKGKKGDFNYKDYCASYEKIKNKLSLSETDRDAVIEEIEIHTGLILKNGYRNYEYSHLSMQEYFTAQYLVKLTNAAKTWEHGLTLLDEHAIATTLSSESNEYFIDIISRVIDSETDHDRPQFITKYITRLNIEKPTFDPDLRFGFVCFILLIVVGFLNEQLKIFFKRSDIRDSILMASNYFYFKENVINENYPLQIVLNSDKLKQEENIDFDNLFRRKRTGDYLISNAKKKLIKKYLGNRFDQRKYDP